MDLCPYFLYSLSYLSKIRTGDAHNNLLRDYKFHENWHNESYTLFKDINTFLPIPSTLSLHEIRYKTAAHNTVDHL